MAAPFLRKLMPEKLFRLFLVSSSAFCRQKTPPAISIREKETSINISSADNPKLVYYGPSKGQLKLIWTKVYKDEQAGGSLVTQLDPG